jgi:hypothetical protein
MRKALRRIQGNTPAFITTLSWSQIFNESPLPKKHKSSLFSWTLSELGMAYAHFIIYIVYALYTCNNLLTIPLAMLFH